MITQDVAIPVNGSTMPAYLARPENGSGPHPAVIVLHEVFGFTPETKRVTELLPSIGYNGLAINYYHRTNQHFEEAYTEAGYERSLKVASDVTARQMVADVRAAVQWLNAQSFVKAGKIATWGFGYGALGAFVTSSLTELSGAIAFYPTHFAIPMLSGGEPPIEHANEVAIPLFLVFGDQDYFVSRFDMDNLHRTLLDAGKDVRIQIYPSVGHSFFRHGRPQAIAELTRYSDEAIAQAVADSWNMVQRFLLDIFNRPQRAAEIGDIRTKRTQSAPV